MAATNIRDAKEELRAAWNEPKKDAEDYGRLNTAVEVLLDHLDFADKLAAHEREQDEAYDSIHVHPTASQQALVLLMTAVLYANDESRLDDLKRVANEYGSTAAPRPPTKHAAGSAS